MRKLIAALAVALSVAPGTAYAGGSPAVAVASGHFGASSCLTLAGARTRWLGTYTQASSASLPAGACSEADPHADLTVSCAVAVVEKSGTVLFAAAHGTDGVNYLVKVVDGGPGGADAVGIAVGRQGAVRCGAAAVVATPAHNGVFVVLPAA